MRKLLLLAFVLLVSCKSREEVCINHKNGLLSFNKHLNNFVFDEVTLYPLGLKDKINPIAFVFSCDVKEFSLMNIADTNCIKYSILDYNRLKFKQQEFLVFVVAREDERNQSKLRFRVYWRLNADSLECFTYVKM